MSRKDRQQELENHGTAQNIAFLIAGIGIGSGIALLLAPDSGEEVRHAIGRGFRKTMKHIGRHGEDLRDRADDLLEHARHLGEHGSRLFRFTRRAEVERRRA